MHWIAFQPSPAWLADTSTDAAADPLTLLAWQALRFTPKVAQVHVGPAGRARTGAEAPPPNALVLEISASERLFGGRQRLLRLFHEQFRPLANARYAQAATSLVAIAKLQVKVEKGSDSLPLWALAAAHPHLGMLARVGCTRWGELRALPRGGVARRFGVALLDALDRAYGQQPELYPWVTLPDVFSARLELQARVESAPALVFGAQRLLRQLQAWLQLRNQGITALEFGWTLDVRRHTASEGALTLRTAQATQDMAHVQRLLAENLARTELPAPALYVHLRSLHTERLPGDSASLVLEDIRPGDDFYEMAERLAARLGPSKVLQLHTFGDYRPERLQSWRPVTPQSLKTAIESGSVCAYSTRAKAKNDEESLAKFADTFHADALYPSWLLHQPLPLQAPQGRPDYLGPLTLLSGPERIETAWWEGPATLRDYYIARNPQAGLVWLYRERLQRPDGGQGWYLQGVFG
jgi:protein ImuB